jgi:hypothetical protein
MVLPAGLKPSELPTGLRVRNSRSIVFDFREPFKMSFNNNPQIRPHPYPKLSPTPLLLSQDFDFFFGFRKPFKMSSNANGNTVEAPLPSHSAHVSVAEDLPYILPSDPRAADTSHGDTLLDLPIIQEMAALKKELGIADDPEELDAILSGTLLDHLSEGLTDEEKRVIQGKIRDLRKMSLNDLLEYVALCTF